jgi:hypothetical protein
MLKTEVARGPGGRVLLMDSIAAIAGDDAGAIVVSGSHGGSSAAEYAKSVPLALAFFNDAGVGKDDAGIVGIGQLQARGVPAGTVAHVSARIGDARDAWDSGRVSHLNEAARALGLTVGEPLQPAIRRLLATAFGT